MKIGIVTFEFPKLSKNGGIGTAYGRLADVLAAQGHEVSVFYVDIQQTFQHQAALLKSSLKIRRTIDLKIISIDESKYRHQTWAVARSLSVYEKLKSEELDVLHFHDCMGYSWSVSTVQKLGLGFTKTKIVLGMHGPNYWVNWAHNRNIHEPIQIQEYELEKFAYENANAIVSPSQYLIDFLTRHGWKSQVSPKVIPNCTQFPKAFQNTKELRPHIHEFIFFGRLEPRKGVQLFTNAILKFFAQKKKSSSDEFLVTYLGKDRRLNDGRSAKEYIHTEFESLINRGLKLNIYSDFDSKQCQEYFSSHPHALIVLPSLADNSPYAIVECLEQSLQFICSNVGGQQELIDSSYWDTHTFAPTVNALCEKLDQHTSHQMGVPRPSPSLLKSNQSWEKFHTNKFDKGFSELPTQSSLDIAIRASSDMEDLKCTIQSLLSVRRVQSLFIYVLEDDYAQWSSRELGSVKSLLKKSPAQIQMSLVFSGGHHEIFDNLNHRSNADYLFLMNAGEALTPEGAQALESMRPTSEDILLFGYEREETPMLPPPVCLANDIFYDSLSKFPAIIRRACLKTLPPERVHRQTSRFSLATDYLLFAQANSKKILSLPICLINTSIREKYLPYSLAGEEIFQTRLKSMEKMLPSTTVEKLKMSFVRKQEARQKEKSQ